MLGKVGFLTFNYSADLSTYSPSAVVECHAVRWGRSRFQHKQGPRSPTLGTSRWSPGIYSPLQKAESFAKRACGTRKKAAPLLAHVHVVQNNVISQALVQIHAGTTLSLRMQGMSVRPP